MTNNDFDQQSGIPNELPQQLPSRAIIVNDDGMPAYVLDVDKLQADATILMYEMAAAAGDNDALDAIGIRWTGRLDPDYFGGVAAAALSLLVRNVLDPTLETIDRALPNFNFRAKLAGCRDDTIATLGPSSADTATTGASGGESW